METTMMGYIAYRVWGIWGSYDNIPKAIFYLGLASKTCVPFFENSIISALGLRFRDITPCKQIEHGV